MNDVTAQAFREAADQETAAATYYATVSNPQAAADHHARAALLDAAAEQREQLDVARADLVARREAASRFLTHSDTCVSASAYAVVGVCDGTLALLQPDRTEP